MKKLAVLIVCAAMLASCDGFKGGSKDLKAENDSLLIELSQRNAELDEMMGTFNEIQEGFRQINDAESRVDLQRGTITENSASAKQQIASDIEFITKQMEENKAQIAKLQAMLKSSKNNSAQLKKAVESLTQELVTKQQRIEELQAELASKNIRIQELDAAVSGLSADKESLAAENEAKARTVAEQDKAINAAWFVFGTKSELKSQKILQSGDVLKNADFNKDYFTQIDIRTTKDKYGLGAFFDSFEHFYSLYQQRNTELWIEYGNGRITKEELNRQRFLYPLEAVGAGDSALAVAYSEGFFSVIPTKSRLMPHAKEVLEYLVSRYNLFILSNGFHELQSRKMHSAGIDHYFKKVILSDDIGLLKPVLFCSLGYSIRTA